MPGKSIRVPTEYLTAFGRFVVVWSKFEHAMAYQFSKAAEVPIQKASMIFFSINGFAGHRDLLKAAIADRWSRQPPQEITDILSDAEEINTVRNELVHGDWMEVRDDRMHVSVVKPKSAMRLYTMSIGVGDIQEYTAQIEGLIDRLMAAPLLPIPRPQKHGKKDAAN
jgi:hypothetical protein